MFHESVSKLKLTGDAALLAVRLSDDKTTIQVCRTWSCLPFATKKYGGDRWEVAAMDGSSAKGVVAAMDQIDAYLVKIRRFPTIKLGSCDRWFYNSWGALCLEHDGKRYSVPETKAQRNVLVKLVKAFDELEGERDGAK